MSSDNLSVPLLKMARFFLVPPPPVADVPAIRARASAIRARGVTPSEGEVRLLAQVEARLGEVPADEENALLRKSLAGLAGLVLAIIEDHEFAIPADRHLGGTASLDALAVQLGWESKKRSKLVRAALEKHGLAVERAADVAALHARTKDPDPRLLEALQRTEAHLRQGELLLERKTDPAAVARHRTRLALACRRTTLLLARLLAVPAADDSVHERRILVQREVKLVELDALGIEKLSEEAQIQGTTEKLAATQTPELGTKVVRGMTSRIRRNFMEAASAAAELDPVEASEDAADDNWLFDADEK